MDALSKRSLAVVAPEQISAEQAIRRISDLGAASKLAYLVLWEWAGGRQDYVDTAPELLAAECGCRDMRSAEDWLKRLVEQKCIEDSGQRRGRMRRLLVLDPRGVDQPVVTRPDPQRVFAGFVEVESSSECTSDASPQIDIPGPALHRSTLSQEEVALQALVEERRAPYIQRESRATPRLLSEQLSGVSTQKPPTAKNARKNGSGDFCAKTPGRSSDSNSLSSKRTKNFNLEILGSQRELTSALIQPRGFLRGNPQSNSSGEIGQSIEAPSIEAQTRRQEAELIAELRAPFRNLFFDTAQTIVGAVLSGWLDWPTVQRKIDAARRATAQRPDPPGEMQRYFIASMKNLFRDRRQPWPTKRRPPEQ